MFAAHRIRVADADADYGVGASFSLLLAQQWSAPLRSHSSVWCSSRGHRCPRLLRKNSSTITTVKLLRPTSVKHFTMKT